MLINETAWRINAVTHLFPHQGAERADLCGMTNSYPDVIKFLNYSKCSQKSFIYTPYQCQKIWSGHSNFFPSPCHWRWSHQGPGPRQLARPSSCRRRQGRLSSTSPLLHSVGWRVSETYHSSLRRWQQGFHSSLKKLQYRKDRYKMDLWLQGVSKLPHDCPVPVLLHSPPTAPSIAGALK